MNFSEPTGFLPLTTSRQILDMVSPSNFLLTNPEALRVTAAKGGMNLVNGLKDFAEDWERDLPLAA
jgi:polyhydroxyalkanoate synthase